MSASARAYPTLRCSPLAAIAKLRYRWGMINLLRRYVARRQLRPVVSVLPRALAKAFGPSDAYTFPQAKRVISALHLNARVEPYAFASACTFKELQKSNLPMSADNYHGLRIELAELFDLRGADFTIKHLLVTHYSSHNPAPENPYIAGGGM